ncbi:MAG TPA: hypothetical protein PKV83_00145 [Methanothrix sp.]|nr:hypothetical protein [Methanothrix sp.]
MKLMAVIVLLLILEVASGYTEIQGEEQMNQSQGSDEVGRPIIISYRNPIGGYRDPSQYSSPSVKFVHPTHNQSNPVEPYENGTTIGMLLPTVRNSSTFFSMSSDVEGRGSFNEYKTAYDIMGLVSKKTSSAINGELRSNDVMLFKSLAGEYNLSQTQSGNSTNIFLNGSVPTIVFSQSYSWFLGDSYREKNSYFNNGDLIRDSYTGGAIRKNTTYFSGLDDIYVLANVTPSQLSKATYINSSTIYVVDTRFVGISSFELASPKRDLFISQDYTGEIALNRRMKLENYSTFQRANERTPACCYTAQKEQS